MIPLQDKGKSLEHFSIVKPLIQKRVKSILAKGIKRKKRSIVLTRKLREFLSDLLIDPNLEYIICSPAPELIFVIQTIQSIYPEFFDDASDENFVLRNIFIAHCYDDPAFDKLEFIEKVSTDTCPYCNRNYIYSLDQVGGIKPPIDHFYPKGKYPVFSVSYYNLIPSCQTCNGFGAKQDHDPIEFDLLSPYLIKMEDFKFTFAIKSINIINPLLDRSSISVKFLKKRDAHLQIFKLDGLYAKHTDHVLELIIKSKLKYTSKYREYLKKYASFKFSDVEIDRLILGNYAMASEVHKRPLAKLYQDIGKELGLIA